MRQHARPVAFFLALFLTLHAPAQPEFNVGLDGIDREWPEGSLAAADQEFLYLRLPFGQMRSLMTEGKPAEIRLDLDADASTGDRGADMTIELRPPPSWRQPYFFATSYDAGGGSSELRFEALEPVIMPNHAAETFEMRLRRDAVPMLLGTTRLRGTMTLTASTPERDGRRTVWKDQEFEFGCDLPAGIKVRPVDAALPPKAEGSVRLVSHNVLWSNPEEDPEPFARMYRALRPDIYLIQEWGRGPWSPAYEARLERWFSQNVDPDADWTAVRSSGWGVAVVTPHPVIGRGPTELRAETLTRWDFPVRYAGAVVLTPEGPFAVGSIHLKAGGSMDTEEDQRRFDEARAIRGAMSSLGRDASRVPGDSPHVTVLGGDFNHLGKPLVPETAVTRLDTDGSPLEFAFTPVLGTDDRYSYGGPAYGHRRSFLDYIAFADESAAVTAAFVLDTEILSDSSLQGMGLRRTDSSAADHMPVVVDLDPAD